jgi:hypothetical protein
MTIQDSLKSSGKELLALESSLSMLKARPTVNLADLTAIITEFESQKAILSTELEKLAEKPKKNSLGKILMFAEKEKKLTNEEMKMKQLEKELSLLAESVFTRDIISIRKKAKN